MLFKNIGFGYRFQNETYTFLKNENILCKINAFLNA